MKVFNLFIFWALGCFCGETYYLSIGAIFQNEAPYLKEWIEYHLLMGVDRFYLYNNRSTDNYREILSSYVEKGIVHLENWPPSDDLSKPQLRAAFRQIQIGAYNHCVKQCDSRWLAIIDVDEFIVPVKHPNLVSFLSSFDLLPSIGGIRVNWQIYGTSHLEKISDGKLLIESLLWKANSNYLKNENVKTILRPEAIRHMKVHYAEYKEGFRSWPENGARKSIVRTDEIRINHYWTRAEDFFYSTKKDRLLERTRLKYEEILDEFNTELNQVYDPILLPIVPLLKERLSSTNDHLPRTPESN